MNRVGLSTSVVLCLAPLVLASGCLQAKCPGSGSESGDCGLVLDYTAHVEGAVQVSGMATSADGAAMALVTDFEKVVLVDTASIEATGGFSVQLGALPRQGSAEAIGYLANGDIAILYPDKPLVRVYAAPDYATVARELPLDAVGTAIHGALSIDAHELGYLVAGDQALELVQISMQTGEVVLRTPITGDIHDAVSGLSWGHDAGAAQLWAVTEDNRIFDLDPETGAAEELGVVDEVSEASAIDALIGHEGEAMLAVADDGNAHNDVPGPIRLYLLGDEAR